MPYLTSDTPVVSRGNSRTSTAKGSATIPSQQPSFSSLFSFDLFKGQDVFRKTSPAVSTPLLFAKAQTIPDDVQAAFDDMMIAMKDPDSGQNLNHGVLKPFMQNPRYQSYADALLAHEPDPRKVVPALYRDYIYNVWANRLCEEVFRDGGSAIDIEKSDLEYFKVYRDEKSENESRFSNLLEEGTHKPTGAPKQVVFIGGSAVMAAPLWLAGQGFKVTNIHPDDNSFLLAHQIRERLPDNLKRNLTIKKHGSADSATYQNVDAVVVSPSDSENYKPILEAVSQAANEPGTDAKRVFMLKSRGLGQLQIENPDETWLKDNFEDFQVTPFAKYDDIFEYRSFKPKVDA
ncbi:MAG: hypothetical protein VKJ04_01360 [Vampirovibrionales bacterium]|nr:hypothetical protein [Vampirovibrionales bacterium]